VTNTNRIAPDFEVGSACDPGRKRDGDNQDRVQVLLPGVSDVYPTLLLVADGMGGHIGGATASKIVIDTFTASYLAASHPADYLSLLEECAHKAHQAVRARGAASPDLANMGSTLVAVALTETRAFVLNVGDSRAYLLRGKQVLQISQDQSLVAEQVRAGLLTPAEALTHPKRNRVTMAITAKRTDVVPYFVEVPIEPDDIVLLCSDGLWGVVPESLIWAAASEMPPQQAADKLVAIANAHQGPDNISAVLARRADRVRTNVSTDMDDTSPNK